MDKLARTDDDAQKLAREKRAAKDERFPRPPHCRERLPDGAHFDVTYSAADARWHGTLEADGHKVEASCSGVFTLLSVLDAKFRARTTPPSDAPVALPRATLVKG